jgi:VCBS repeat-containing protein
VDGIDKLEKLPFDGWGRETTAPEEYRGAPYDPPTGISLSWVDAWNDTPPFDDAWSAAYVNGGKFVLFEAGLGAKDGVPKGTRYTDGDGAVEAASTLHVTTLHSNFTGMTIGGTYYSLAQLAAGQTVAIDLDRDGSPDVTIKFTYIGNNNVQVTVTLENAIQHVDDLGNALNEVLTGLGLTAHDDKGNSASGSMTVLVVDDNPLAFDDYQKFAVEDADGLNVAVQITGNVVSGDGDMGQAGARTGVTVQDATGEDMSGADGYAVNPVTWHAGAATTGNSDANPNAGQDFKTDFRLEGSGPVYTVMDGDKIVGDITLNADGSYVFNSNAGYEPEHGEHTISIPYSVMDGDKDLANAVLHLTIENVNDRPVFTVDPDAWAGAGEVKETGVYAAGERTDSINPDELHATVQGGVGDGQHKLGVVGQLHATDADSDELTYGAGKPAEGSGQTVAQNTDGSWSITDHYGTLTIQPDGRWIFELNDASANHLGEGETLTIGFPVLVQDNSGAANDTGTGTIAITVHGSNDAPSLSLGNELSIMEGVDTKVNTFVSGKATATDPDDNDTLTFGLVGPGDHVVATLFVAPDGEGGYSLSETAPGGGNYYGAFTIDRANGDYKFTVNNGASCVDSMNVEDRFAFEVPIVVQDNHGAYDLKKLGVTILGANDNPYITGGLTGGAVKEEGVYAAGERDGYLHDGTTIDPKTGKPFDDENANTTPGGVGAGQHQGVFNGKLTAADPDDPTGSLAFGPQNTSASGVTDKGDGVYTMDGAYGTLTIRPDGSYTYILDEAKAQSLTEGQKATDSFAVQVTDPHGGTGAGTLAITVHGTNDAPVFSSGQQTYILNEDGGVYLLKGQVAATDPDAGETAKLEFGFTTPEGKVVTTLYAAPDGEGGVTFSEGSNGGNNFGKFTIDAKSGEYKFEMNNSAPCVQELGLGDTAEIRAPVVVRDPHGAYDQQDLIVNINGADDKATISMDALNPSQTVIEEGVLPGGNAYYAGKPTVEGTLVANDPDKSDVLIYKVQDKDGKWHKLNEEVKQDEPLTIEAPHGTVEFTLNADGSYHYKYTLNNADPDVNALDRQETTGDGFAVSVESGRYDENGDFVAHDHVDAKVEITIVGTNDKPVILDKEIFVHKADPDNALDGAFAGRISVDDPDHSDFGNIRENLDSGKYNLVVTGEGGKNFVAAYDTESGKEIGAIEISPDGSYQFTLNDYGKQLLLAKAEGEYLDVHAGIRVTDPLGAYDETVVHWQLEGRDDAPRFSAGGGSIMEDGWNAGRPVIIDADPESATYGNLIPNPNYAEDKGQDSIKGSLSAVAVDTTDAGSRDFTYGFDLNGDHKADAVYDLYVLPDSSFSADKPEGDYVGQIHLNPGGAWQFDINQNSDAVNRLRPEDSITIKVPVVVEDARGYSTNSTLNIAVNGANDRPAIDLAPDLKLDQDPADPHGTDSYVVTGTALASDPDNVVYRPDESGGNLGGTTGNASSSEVTFCFIDPVNGQPVQTLQLDHGSVTMHPKTGEYTYTFNVFDDSNYDPDTNKTFPDMSDSFDIYVRDKNGAYSDPETVKVDIGEHDKWGHGIGGGGDPFDLDTGAGFWVQEDNGDYDGHGDQDVRDSGYVKGGQGYFFLDANGRPVQSVPAVGEDGRVYGAYVINPITGEYQLILNNGSDFVQELNQDELVRLNQPTVGSWNGGHGAMPPHEVRGTEDRPEFDTKNPTHSLTESAAQNGGDSVSGQLESHDLDHDEVLTYGPKDPAAGNVTDNGDGTWTIKGAWGNLVINGETGEYTYTTFPGKDIPYGAHSEVFDVVVLDATGRGETALDTSIGTDNTQIRINVTGLNTPPEYTGPALSAIFVKEDDINSADGKYVVGTGSIAKTDFTDADGDVVSFGVSISEDGAPDKAYAIGEYGTLFIKPDGSYEYRLNNNMSAVQGLKEGEFLEETFYIIANDGHGGTTSVLLPVKIEGTNDDPILSLNDLSGAQYGAGVSLDMVAGRVGDVGGKAIATDVDVSDTHFHYSLDGGTLGGDGLHHLDAFAEITIDGVKQTVVVGEFTMDPATGEYHFIAGENLSHLKGGEQLKVTADVVVESSDDDGVSGGTASAVVTVNITGANDAPEMQPLVIHQKEDDVYGNNVSFGQGQLTAYDPDADPGDQVSFTVQAGGGVIQTGPTTWEGKYGTLTVQADGTYTYTLHNDKVQFLAEGEHDYDSFTVIVKDQYGASSTSEIKADIEGANDRPVLTNIFTDVQVTEGHASGLIGNFTSADTDIADLAFHVFRVEGAEPDDSRTDYDMVVHGDHGDLYYNSKDGSYEYVAASNESLSKHTELRDTFTVLVDDASDARNPDAYVTNNLSASKALTVIITGTNQAPELEAIVNPSMSSGECCIGSFKGSDINADDTLTYIVDGGVTDSGRAGYNMVVHGDYGALYYNSATGAYMYEAGHIAGADVSDAFQVRLEDDYKAASDIETLTVSVTGGEAGFVLNAGAKEVVSGGNVSFHLSLQNGEQTMYAATAMAVGFVVANVNDPGFQVPAGWLGQENAVVDGYGNTLTWTKGDDGYLLTATLAQGQHEMDISFQAFHTEDTPVLIDPAQTLQLTLQSVLGGNGEALPGIDSDISVDGGSLAGSPLAFTLLDADYAHVASLGISLEEAVGKVVHQVSEWDETSGMNTYYGSDQDEIIIGSDESDLIYVGGGNNILYGGGGDDIFVWGKDSMMGGTDIIKDFQQGDSLRFDDVFNAAGDGNDALDKLLNGNNVVWDWDTVHKYFAAADDTTSIELSIAEATATLTVSYKSEGVQYSQSVELHGHAIAEQFAGAADAEELAAMLQQIIKVGGNI